ncbi:hypothetical protein CDAR_297851 [Caerostris darwini]|uniref:Uncharacterized protein n=1 Tax=Caerostris darwini TaxID=1538125 RepID=A0AAV4U7S8_9ARAC|nr:hypothetical protein CDAR_297851 [Caerostris darwini]
MSPDSQSVIPPTAQMDTASVFNYSQVHGYSYLRNSESLKFSRAIDSVERLNVFVQTDFHPLRSASTGQHAGELCALLGTPRHVCKGLFHFKITRPSARAPFGIHSFHDRRMFPQTFSVNILPTGCSCREQKTRD